MEHASFVFVQVSAVTSPDLHCRMWGMHPKMSLLPDVRLGRVATISRSGAMNEGWVPVKRVTSRGLGITERKQSP